MNNWQPGQKLDNNKYTIQKKIGEGGFGVTFLARNNHNDKLAVIKTVNQKHKPKQEQVDEQKRENQPFFEKLCDDLYNEAVQAAKFNSNPHVVKIEEVFKENNIPCLVMEYIEGENLADKIQKEGRLPESEALSYIQQIGAALTAIHQQQLLHRDVKPSNILIRADGTGAILIDFGTARQFDNEQTLTIYSSVGYTPLEQSTGEKQQGPYTDVYALAATLYFILTKQLPPQAYVRYHDLNEGKPDPLKPPQTHIPSLSNEVNKGILQGMALSRQERPQTINGFLSLLPLSQLSLSHNQETIKPTQTDIPTVPSLPPPKSLTHGLLVKILPLIGAIIMTLLFFSPSNWTTTAIRDPKQGGLTIQHPPTWKVESRASSFKNKISKEIAKIDAPQNQGTVTIHLEDSEGLSLDKYTEKTLAGIKQEMAREIDDDDIKEKKIDNQDAVEAIYLRKDNLKIMQTWTLINNQAYIITYTAEEDKYAIGEKIARKIINRLEINEQ